MFCYIHLMGAKLTFFSKKTCIFVKKSDLTLFLSIDFEQLLHKNFQVVAFLHGFSCKKKVGKYCVEKKN